MKNIWFIITGFFLSFFSTVLGDKPNILFIISDDQAPDTIAALGNKNIHTPNLDRLVQAGTSFTHCFNQGSWSGAVCVASRTMLITGQSVYRAPKNKAFLDKWAHAKGVLAVEEQSPVMTWPEVFRKAGYQTFLTGKWHNNTHAAEIGFTQIKALGAGMYETHEGTKPKIRENQGYLRPSPTRQKWNAWDPKFHGVWKPLVRDLQSDGKIGEYYEVAKHSSELFADHAVEFLASSKKSKTPFFMYVSFNAPHDPRQSPKSFVERYPVTKTKTPKNYLSEHPFDNGAITIRDEQLAPFPRTKNAIRTHRAEYYAMISHIDEQIGRILNALEKSGQADDTYIIFTSDHGLAVGSHGLMGKQNPYDHSIRMPFLISGPDVPKGKRVRELIYMQSVYPTTCELAGLNIPESVDFPSLKNLALGKKGSGEKLIYGCYQDTQRLVRSKTHKLIFYPKLKRYQLFDLVKDPYEITDQFENPVYKQVKIELMQALKHKRKELGDGLIATK